VEVAPQLLEQDVVRVVVFDNLMLLAAASRGKWFQLLPDLLGVHCKFEIELVRTFEWISPDDGKEWEVSSCVVELPGARHRRCTIDDYRPKKNATPHVAYFPGASAGYMRGLLRTAQMILKSGGVCIGTDVHWMWYGENIALLRAYGFGVVRRLFAPSECVVRDDPDALRWSDMRWALNRGPKPDWIVDYEQINKVQRLSSQGYLRRGAIMRDQIFGRWFHDDDAQKRIIGCPGGLGIEMSTGDIVAITSSKGAPPQFKTIKQSRRGCGPDPLNESPGNRWYWKQRRLAARGTRFDSAMLALDLMESLFPDWNALAGVHTPVRDL